MVLKNASNGQYQITNKLPLFPNTYDFLSFFKGKIVFHYLCLGGERERGGGGVPIFILQLFVAYNKFGL